jgi:LacI family transcriptional regulator
MRTPTSKDVAARAGVSLQTVSRVVNNAPSVHSETRARVQRAIDELNYKPDVAARNLRGTKAYAIGLVYDNPNANYVVSVINGLLKVCNTMGFGLQIHPTDLDSKDLNNDLHNLVNSSRLAGLVLTPPMSEQAELIDYLVAHSIPFVRIISATADPGDGLPCVYVDDRDAAYDITEHLIQMGHNRIGFLWGSRRHRSSTERFRGYTDALHDYGLVKDDTLIVEGDFCFDDGFRGARKLLALSNRPTAIFGSNDEIAAGVLAAARSTGLEVPYDLSIAGFEDSPFSRQSWPALTTARQATQDIAEHAARLLIEQLNHSSSDDVGNKGFSPELVVRGSTAPPRTRIAPESDAPVPPT